MTEARPALRLQRVEKIGGPTFFEVENRWYEASDGSEHLRSVVLHLGAVAVVPFDGERVWMIRQDRVAVGRRMLEIPAGKLDVEGESIEAAARRECAEEVGLIPATLTLVHRFYNSPGHSDELTHVYIGEDLAETDRAPAGAEEESADIVAVTLAEVREMLESDALEDAKTLIGLHALIARHGRS